MENKFFLGQKVWSSIWGHGKIDNVTQSGDGLLITVRFPDNYGAVVHDHLGRVIVHRGDAAPTLFPTDEIPDFYKPYAQDPRIGKWGYFWDDGTISSFGYAKLKDITDGRFDSGYTNYDNFSLEIPEHCK